MFNAKDIGVCGPLQRWRQPLGPSQKWRQIEVSIIAAKSYNDCGFLPQSINQNSRHRRIHFNYGHWRRAFRVQIFTETAELTSSASAAAQRM